MLKILARVEFREGLILAVFCVFFFFYGLAVFGLVGADEPRYAQIAREMLHRRDWVTPTLGGTAWLEKPSLYYWMAMLSYALFGVSDWAARVPSALLATVMVAAVYFFMRRCRPGSQLEAALLTCSSVGVFAFARAAATDTPLAACFALGMLSWFLWSETQNRRWLLLFYVFIALGALAKGPVAPVLAALVVVVFAQAVRQPRIILRTLWLPGILVFLAVALPWYVAVQRQNPQFFNQFFLQHNLARFTTNLYQHHRPFWYYVPVLLLGLFPWTAIAIAGWVNAVKSWRAAPDAETALRLRRLRLFLAVWGTLPLLFFSISGSKLPGYILPAVPAWILLAADYLLERRSEPRGLPYWLLALHAVTVAAITAVVLLAPRFLFNLHARVPLPAVFASTAFAGITLAFMLLLFRWRGLDMLRTATLLPVVLALAFVIKVAGPRVDLTRSARPVSRDLARPGFSEIPIVGQDISRSLEYGLGFYRNQPVFKPADAPRLGPQYLLIKPSEPGIEAPESLNSGWAVEAGRFPPQHVQYLLITRPAASPRD